MKKLIMVTAVVTLAVASFLPLVSWAQGPWRNSPHNWNNSPYNWQNDPSNWNNLPSNWKNSPHYWKRRNGVYDESGNPLGYITPKPGGGFNIFDNEGNRIGYKP